MTQAQWETVAGVILMLVAVVGFIVVMNIFDSSSRRERGLPKKKRKGIRKGNGDHEK